MRALVIGWASLRHGEATPVDVLGMRRVDAALSLAEVPHDLAWGPSHRLEGLDYEEVDPARYSHVVFVSGAVRGRQVCEVHRRFAHCHRIAVGVSVADPGDDAVTGFDQVLARDHQGIATPDLSIDSPTDEVLVAGLILAREHTAVRSFVTKWVAGIDCGRVPLEPGLAFSDWERCATPDQFASILSHLDVVVTTRLDGLVLGLRAGVPVLAVDPVAGGGALTAQADALGWPALVPAEEAGETENLDSWWRWCSSVQGRAVAALRALPTDNVLMRDMVKAFKTGPVR
ncbi:polysaccharide pyruvyl transferase family protein [Amycolatopsis sp. BJA-103]|uniref:polysaccharide pyruvyl transferase family protein n=1 Tax=unclassified Amycolatopsis TaxID=2618356 RepID=UPI000CA17CA0|nr:polysaccharide pyruvyl transferase family protein [Amycolatopsis sp. BJA-103]AUI58163.1 polysaccharide pyruvyl transferase [Amycolatopsis sp. BJA-103]PNE13206.1 polysaccharide pyruvyl transferase [Amycolatopsis sp. BJA-103]